MTRGSVGVVGLALCLALGCSGREEGVTQNENDAGQQDGGGNVTPHEPAEPVLGFGVAGGTVQSQNFRLRVNVSANLSTPNAASENVTTQPGAEVQGPNRGE